MPAAVIARDPRGHDLGGASARPGCRSLPRASRGASWFDAGRHAPGEAKPRFLAAKSHGFSAWVVTR